MIARLLKPLILLYLWYHYRQHRRAIHWQLSDQEKTFRYLIRNFSETAYGQNSGIMPDMDYRNFASSVPVIGYDALKSQVDEVLKGKENVLWPGKPLWFAKTSGTGGEAKLIPVTKASLKNQRRGPVRGFANAVFSRRLFSLAGRKQLLFSDSASFTFKNGYRIGALSASLMADLPRWAGLLILPGKSINALPALDEKMAAILKQVPARKPGTMVIMPVWLQYLLSQMERQQRRFRDVFPDLQLISFSGMDYAPYLPFFKKHLDPQTHCIQTYPASEGFFAYQHGVQTDMLLICDMGIFYEFEEVHSGQVSTLAEVQSGTVYNLIITSSNGLCRFRVGDTVVFRSVKPYSLTVAGRTTDFISLYGENLLLADAQRALDEALAIHGFRYSGFVVFPADANSRPGHIWMIETESVFQNTDGISKTLHQILNRICANYDDLDRAGIIAAPRVYLVPPGFFSAYLADSGKGLQAKLNPMYNLYMGEIMEYYRDRERS